MIDIGWRVSLSLSLSESTEQRMGRAHALFFTSSTYVSTRVNALERARWHCLPFVFIEKLNHHEFHFPHPFHFPGTSIPWEIIAVCTDYFR